MERLYSKIQYLGKEGKLKECKGSSIRIWKKTKCRSWKIRKVR